MAHSLRENTVVDSETIGSTDAADEPPRKGSRRVSESTTVFAARPTKARYKHQNYLIKYTTYTLAFARITPGSNGSELFIRISALTANPCADSP